MTDKIAWVIGVVAFVLAVLFAPEHATVDVGTWIAGLSYLIGLHWIVAYCFGGPMYGALRLQPTERVARAFVFALGVALVFVALQYVLGFGGPIA